MQLLRKLEVMAEILADFLVLKVADLVDLLNYQSVLLLSPSQQLNIFETGKIDSDFSVAYQLDNFYQLNKRILRSSAQFF